MRGHGRTGKVEIRTGKCGDRKGNRRPRGARHLNARPGPRLGRGLEANGGGKWGTLPGRPRDRISTIPRPRRARPSPPPGEPVTGPRHAPDPSAPTPVRSHLRCGQSHRPHPHPAQSPLASRPSVARNHPTRTEPLSQPKDTPHLLAIAAYRPKDDARPKVIPPWCASSHHQRWQMTATMQPDAPDPTPKRPHAQPPNRPNAQTQTDAQTQKAPDRRIGRSGTGTACETPLPTCETARCGRASPSAAGSARGRRP
jgi:hypothetical protein